MVDKARLKELALSASPGPHEITFAGQDDMTEEECIAEEMPVVSIGPIAYTEFNTSPEQQLADAQYIAALDPETVLALLEENERLHADKELLVKSVVDSFSGSKPLLTREQEDAVADMVREYEETGVLDGA